MGIFLCFIAFVIDSLSRATQGLGPRAQRLGAATSCVAWLGLVAHAVLLLRGIAESEEHCPATTFQPSPSYTAPPNEGSYAHRWTAPEVELVACETSAGPLHLQLRPEWAPAGVAHFLDLVKDGVFSHMPFYDVDPEVSCAFGISGDRSTNERWSETIPEDLPPPQGIPLQLGSLSYTANAATNRTMRMAFSLRESKFDLTRYWDAPIGQVTTDTVETLSTVHSTRYPYTGPDPARIDEGDVYLQIFHHMDYIESCTVTDESVVPVTRCGPSILPYAVGAAVVIILSSLLVFESAKDGGDEKKNAVRAP